jgi:cation:H+ antiporter
MAFAGELQGLPLNQIQRDELWVTATQSVFAVAIIASRSVNRREAWAMLALFGVQLGESWLAVVGVISESISAGARIGVGVMFLVAAGWVLRDDFHRFGRVLREGLRSPWSELEAEVERVQ